MKRSVGGTKPQDSPVLNKVSRRSSINVFDFEQHCIFCGKFCNLTVDKKNPKRWRRVVLCKTADRMGQNSFKDEILDICAKRQDTQSAEVRVRLEGAISDLHAADARYHNDCGKSFMNYRNVDSASKYSATSDNSNLESALEELISVLYSDKTKIWNSVELFQVYQSLGGIISSRKSFMSHLRQHIGDDIVILSGQGVASLILLKDAACSAINLVSAQDDDDIYEAVHKVGKTIASEIHDIDMPTDQYQTKMNFDIAYDQCSPTLNALLADISTKLNLSLPGVLIGNIVTGVARNQPTSLQVAMGLFVGSRSLIDVMYNYRVTCSYDEVQRFKASAAKAASEDLDLRGAIKADDGLVQVIVDNFDANISSQNGLKSTHSLALLLAIDNPAPCFQAEVPHIPRLSHAESRKPIDIEVPIERYNGPKKPPMPAKFALKHVPPLSFLAHQKVQLFRSQTTDLAFIKQVTSEPNTPEFGGYNTRICRTQGHAIKPATRAIYTPLIDMSPANPDTILTAMKEAERLTKEAGQHITIFTCDQQLYRVTLNVIWVYPEQFINFIPRLGGMHMLMSFVGSIGNLLMDSGVEEVLKSTFGSVQHMLSGKKYPQNTRALRILTEEILRPHIGGVQSFPELMDMLDSRASDSPTTKLWVDNLIKPCFVIMAYVRAEREGDWPLHLLAVEKMIPYFFAAGHSNYARYGLYYLRDMKRLPEEVRLKFMNGAHVMRHQMGLFNGIWSDMFIETTFMRYGHGPSGIIGITLQPSTLKKWAYSMHTCSQVIQDVSHMGDTHSRNKQVDVHKEERPSRIKADQQDRLKIREKLLSCIDPLDSGSHPKNIVNISSGRVGPDSVNAHMSVEIGSEQVTLYEQSWPEGFYEPIPKRVITMSVLRKSISVNSIQVFDTNLIFLRVLGVRETRELSVDKLMKYELAPVPASMFNEYGEIRLCKNKSILKNQLQVKIPFQDQVPCEVTFIDGGGRLWTIHWPEKGTVKDYIEKIFTSVTYRLQHSDVYLIFDGYKFYSIKSAARSSRSVGQTVQIHQFTLNTVLPPQKVVLTITENKLQLIKLICEYFVDNAHRFAHMDHTLILKGESDVPIAIRSGVTIQRPDLISSHEEADVLLIYYLKCLMDASPDIARIHYICDDTDVFNELLHFYNHWNLTCNITMTSPIAGRALIDIGASAKKHEDITDSLLAGHSLSGCDTVASLWGKGKTGLAKLIRSGHSLSAIGDPNATMADVVGQATAFTAALYGSKQAHTSMSDVRKEIWVSKISKTKSTKSPQLQSLPPTTEVFVENVKRAHFQAAIWKSAQYPDPPDMDPTAFGWYKDHTRRCLLPVMFPDGVITAPQEILEMVRCGCASVTPCQTGRCSCQAAKLPCTLFCGCQSKDVCRNDFTKLCSSINDEDLDDDEV